MRKGAGGGGIESLPPELPHVTVNYIPLSHIISNTVGYSYQELQNVLETLPSVSSDISKKRRFLDYIIKSRQAFVKLYVLSKWAKVSNDISKCVDVVSWLNGQKNCFNNVINALYGIEKTLSGAKLRNPDIETALEILKKGRPTQNIHNFVPSAPLRPQLVYQVLRNLDVLLSVRLCLVEDLPVQYRDYDIRDGQVKFTIDRAFDVSLGVADDATDARFFLVDFNFCLPATNNDYKRLYDSDTDVDMTSPSVQESDDEKNRDTPVSNRNSSSQCYKVGLPLKVKARLETIINEKLENGKLSSVLDWLLQFAQNYKIACLNNQLHKMTRLHYSGHVHHVFYGARSLLAVEYWCQSTSSNQQGQRSKNIIEIGLLEQQKFKIGINWIREGQLVKELPNNIADQFASSNFDVEWLINQIIDLHVKYIIESTHANLKALKTAKEFFWLSQPNHDMLKISLADSKSVIFTVEKISGFSLLSSPTKLGTSAEKKLNELGDPAHNAHKILLELRQRSLKESLEKKAEATGWIANSNVDIKADHILKLAALHTPTDKQPKVSSFSSACYLRRQEWSSTQFLIILLNAGQRLQWFISEIASKEGEWVIQFLEEIFLDFGDIEHNAVNDIENNEELRTPVYSYGLFEKLASFAGSRFSVHYLCESLVANGIKHCLLQSGGNTPMIVIDLPTLYKGTTKRDISWACSSLLVKLGDNWITIQGKTRKQISVNLISTQHSSVQLDTLTGLFKFDFANDAQTTTNFVQQITDRLSQIERVVEYIDVLKSFSLELISASMDGIKFKYGNDPGHNISILFNDAKKVHLSLDKQSPHSIVSSHLQEILKYGGLLSVINVLKVTLPLYQVLQQLDESTIIVPHTVGDINIFFDSDHVIHVELRSRNTLYVTNASKWPGIEKLWNQKNDNHIVPLGKGLACRVDKIGVILETVRKYI